MYAKTYFETLSTEKQTFQGDTGAGESGCESVNNIWEDRSQRLPLNEWSLGGSTIGNISSLSGGIGGASVNIVTARDDVWMEYADTLGDSLTESKEFGVEPEYPHEIIQGRAQADKDYDGAKHKTHVNVWN